MFVGRVSRYASALVAALILTSLPARVLANSAPVVSNVVATQIPNTGQVRVTFNVSDADGDPVTARLICSSDNGATFDLLPVTVNGDVNQQMPAGPGKQILWDASRDYPGRYWTQVVARIIASDGPATSGEMVLVPAGSFTMGEVGVAVPERNIYLDAFYIDKYEVTNAEYEQFMLAGGYSTQAFWSQAGWDWRNGVGSGAAPAGWGTDAARCGPGWPGFPVSGVSYYEAEAYAAFAGKRLPTEAEWEKAARGTDARAFPWGSGVFDGGYSNFYSSSDPFETGISPAGFFDGRLHPNPPFQTANAVSPYGTHDQAGNIAEWVRDWYGAYDPEALTNPTGPLSGTYRVTRGGSAWDGYVGQASVYLRSSYRSPSIWVAGGSYTSQPFLRVLSVGFRCARSAN